MDDMQLSPENLAAVEALHEQYRADPNSVDPSWRDVLAQLGEAAQHAPNYRDTTLFRAAATATHSGAVAQGPGGEASLLKQERVDALIRAYRSRGHRVADIDPLGKRPKTHPELELGFHGLSDADLNSHFSARSMGAGTLSLATIIERLRKTYCGSVGVQFMHIDDSNVRAWLQARMEGTENHVQVSRDKQLRILAKLTDAEVFETFTAKKFLGARRFSLEGGESLIPLLDTAIEESAKQGTQEIVIGMAHRGRLNVLVNTIGKSPLKMYEEFEDKDPYAKPGAGDVKYHLGYSSDHRTADGGQVHLSLCFNPSHLGFVGPVAAGRVRAKQDRLGDVQRQRVLGILIHGDAAFCGQGSTQELLNMSELKGYATGGTVHILVNNQVGFTTTPERGRSTPYATDVARMLEVPIFHVNGEDPESVTQVVKLALEFRAQFHKDVFIDMYCYRRLGHNESDEPAFTQPVMYQWINGQPTVREKYANNLLKRGDITEAEASQMMTRSQGRFEAGLQQMKRGDKDKTEIKPGVWAPYLKAAADDAVAQKAAVPEDRLQDLMSRITQVPKDFAPHPKLVRLLEQRREMAAGKRPLDWGAGEALAFASLVNDGTRVRLSGQDSGRGTFSHRHAVLNDVNTGATYMPLCHLREGQGVFEVWDSPLSETGVLGFDYGYSLDAPDALVMWEAQFGDFANGAQVIIDQFIASGEVKWQRLSGITLLLPHGSEGAGSEHSSARLERFLELAAEGNMQVTYPTTPAQIYHLLRRQVQNPRRKPLVVMTPKSLLRHPQATSTLAELAQGDFQQVIDEVDGAIAKRADRVLLCTGKVYYDLLAARTAKNANQTAIIRVEEIYPGLEASLGAVMSRYKKKAQVVWVQEEPLNMGAWPHLCLTLGRRLFGQWNLDVVARPAAASPAVGSHSRHQLEQNALMDQAFSS